MSPAKTLAIATALVLAVTLTVKQYLKAGTPINAGSDVVETGFVPVPSPSGTKRNQVLIFAAVNCPKDAARRAADLAAELGRRGISHIRLEHADFEWVENPDPAVLARLETVMRGEIPIVFINGRGKANPGIDEVVAEYRAQRLLSQ